MEITCASTPEARRIICARPSRGWRGAIRRSRRAMPWRRRCVIRRWRGRTWRRCSRRWRGSGWPASRWTRGPSTPASAGAADQLAALQAWNAAGRLPFKNGFTRVLTSPAIVRLGGVASVAGMVAAPRPFGGGLLAAGGAGELAWGTRVTVQDAYRLRLHLSDVHLPAGTRMWVESQGGMPREFGLELLSPQGDLWTPSVKGDSLLFEVHVPAAAGAASFAVREVLELVDLARAGAGVSDTGEASCVIDSSCSAANALPDLASYRHAMAQLFFVEQNQGFICSGGLLRDTKSDFIPYLLTANHCFADQFAAKPASRPTPAVQPTLVWFSDAKPKVSAWSSPKATPAVP